MTRDAQEDGVDFCWTPEHTAAVNALKSELLSGRAFKTPDPSKPFSLYTNASQCAISAELRQDDRPIEYFSRLLTEAEQRYSVDDQELLALISALNNWEHMLRRARVTAYTRAVTYLQQLKTNKPLSSRTARWLEALAEFEGLTTTSV